MEQIPLTAQKRTILGRKVKTLRREGLIPAHVFGHKIKTIHVQVKQTDFAKVFEKAGETGIVDLAIDSQKKPVLIRNVQVHPVTDTPLHIDFYQVNLTEKVKVNVPIELILESHTFYKNLASKYPVFNILYTRVKDEIVKSKELSAHRQALAAIDAGNIDEAHKIASMAINQSAHEATNA